jgi:hypothetical protein
MEEAETWNSSILPANIAAHKPRDILTLMLSNMSYGINGENFHCAKHRQDHFTGLHGPTQIVVNQCLWL